MNKIIVLSKDEVGLVCGGDSSEKATTDYDYNYAVSNLQYYCLLGITLAFIGYTGYLWLGYEMVAAAATTGVFVTDTLRMKMMNHCPAAP